MSTGYTSLTTLQLCLDCSRVIIKGNLFIDHWPHWKIFCIVRMLVFQSYFYLNKKSFCSSSRRLIDSADSANWFQVPLMFVYRSRSTIVLIDVGFEFFPILILLILGFVFFFGFLGRKSSLLIELLKIFFYISLVMIKNL